VTGPRELIANDNATAEEDRPVVTIPADRPDHAYARSGNLLLPLRFARLMAGWVRDGRYSEGRGR
jgi:hypothetical protein